MVALIPYGSGPVLCADALMEAELKIDPWPLIPPCLEVEGGLWGTGPGGGCVVGAELTGKNATKVYARNRIDLGAIRSSLRLVRGRWRAGAEWRGWWRLIQAWLELRSGQNGGENLEGLRSGWG